ncbi:MAG: hypothetical protein ACWA5R_02235 [bacterium]
MPYFVYKIQPQEFQLVKNLELIEQFDKFKAARQHAHQLRQSLESTQETSIEYKVIFADNKLDAEEKLLETREKPILMEHEK